MPRQYNYSRVLLIMKRCGAPLRDPRPLHKKAFKSAGDEGELTYKLKMLQNWQISPEAARYLEMDNKVKENRVVDFTCPQLCLMVYSPNIYQQIID